MDPNVTSYLFTLAGLSATFLGFSGLAIAFLQATRARMTEMHLGLVRVFFVNGLAATAFSLLPPLLNLLALPQVVLWRVSSVLLLAFLLAFGVLGARAYGRTLGWPLPLQVLVGFSISIVVIVLLGLNVAGTFFDPNQGPYVLGATWLLAILGLNFVRNLNTFLQRAGGPE